MNRDLINVAWDRTVQRICQKGLDTGPPHGDGQTHRNNARQHKHSRPVLACPVRACRCITSMLTWCRSRQLTWAAWCGTDAAATLPLRCTGKSCQWHDQRLRHCLSCALFGRNTSPIAMPPIAMHRGQHSAAAVIAPVSASLSDILDACTSTPPISRRDKPISQDGARAQCTQYFKLAIRDHRCTHSKRRCWPRAERFD
jgi:hypothetical protein